MKIRYITTHGTLLATMVLAGCALRPSAADPEQPTLSPYIEAKGDRVVGDDEARELLALPAVEQRRRLDTLLASHPNDLRARFLRTQVEYKLDDAAAVDADSRLVLEDPSLDSHYRQLVLQWRGEALIKLERFEEAVAVASEALEMDPASANALLTRGWARFFINQSENALPDIDRALEVDPNHGIGHYRRARVFDAQGKLEFAAKDFERAIELEPEDSPSHLDFGVLLYTAHNFERALAEFDAGVRLVQNDPFALAWRAQANFALKRFDAAAADNRHVAELGIATEDIGHAFQRVAESLREQNDFAGAVREFKIALEFTRDDYIAIGLFSARVRANPANEPTAKAELASWAKPHEAHAWTDTLVSMLLNRTTLEAALAEADAADTYELKAGQRCEADYYAAERFLGQEQDPLAKRLLEEAYWVCPSSYVEARAVAAERRLINAKTSAK